MEEQELGVSINPVAFLVVQDSNVKLMPVDHDSCIDRLLDYVPDLMQKVNEMFNKSIQQKEERTQKIINEIKNKNTSTNKPKSPEVKGQEQKVEENEKQASYQETSDCLDADGEVFGQ